MQAHGVHLTNEESDILRELNERLLNARRVKLTLPLATSNFRESTSQPTSFLSPKKKEPFSSDNPLKTILLPHSISKQEKEFVNKSNINNNNLDANNNNNGNNPEYSKTQLEFLTQQIQSLQAQVEALVKEQKEQNRQASPRKSAAKENELSSFPSSIPPTLLPKPIPYMEGLVLSRADFLPSGWTDEQSMYSPPSLKLQELDHKSRKKKKKTEKNPEKIREIESLKNSHTRPPVPHEHKKSITAAITTSSSRSRSSSRSTSPLFQKTRPISSFSSPKRERILNNDSAKKVLPPDRSTSAQRQRELQIKSDKKEFEPKAKDKSSSSKRSGSKSKTRPEKVSVIVPPSVSATLKSKKQTSGNVNTSKSNGKGKQVSLVGGFTPLMTVKQHKS
eukprot:TRINITY_DN1940_c0_g1_i1.p1 TRINITY_DN1940_c0_g1~~TRINITY_DN1940_c0_g1_i1.p1  ORF type:complete len:391 (-),score=100.09 TRINITY_DN1940_c0_g1_i1:113-1285(-)